MTVFFSLFHFILFSEVQVVRPVLLSPWLELEPSPWGNPLWAILDEITFGKLISDNVLTRIYLFVYILYSVCILYSIYLSIYLFWGGDISYYEDQPRFKDLKSFLYFRTFLFFCGLGLSLYGGAIVVMHYLSNPFITSTLLEYRKST